MPTGLFFVVCDGMGGHVGGAVASQTAVNSIRQFFESQFYPHLGDALYQALQYANQQIYQTAQARPSLLGMGTTCVLLCFREGLAYTAHVGDSRIYLYRGGFCKGSPATILLYRPS
ncbi:MAG: serine/threonine-protein phosphatase [Microscillaceae bacterium]|nr:serine/threonine-protein phosphatase [Microscillaceae bacterium]